MDATSQGRGPSNICCTSSEAINSSFAYERRPTQFDQSHHAFRERTFSLRGIAAGAVIGSVICFASIYYGLQAGQTNSMPLPSALMGYAVVKPFAKYMRTSYTPMENVLAMTVAASMGGIPMTAGLCGIIPALEYLVPADQNGPLTFSLLRLILWSLSVCLFGVVIATPFREHFVRRSNLRFPTGTAMAVVISMLHGRPDIMERIKEQQTGNTVPSTVESPGEFPPETVDDGSSSDPPNSSVANHDQSSRAINRAPLVSFVISGSLALLTYFVPQTQKVPIFGLKAAQDWAWAVELSAAYVGYGMIMDPLITAHMLLGAFIGWGVLSPLAKSKGWATGPVDSWETGSQGWTVWIALGVILGDSLVGIGWIVIEFLAVKGPNTEKRRPGYSQSLSNPRRSMYMPPARNAEHQPTTTVPNDDNAHADEQSPLLASHNETSLVKHQSENIPGKMILIWLFFVTAFCIYTTWYLFKGLLEVWQIILAIAVILPLGMASIRSMGETDNSLASSLGKVSQFLFALIIPVSNPDATIASLLVGGISEGGSYQSSDVMEHLKTGQLVGASPEGLFYGQIIGSVLGAVFSSWVYKLFTSTSTSLPSEQFPVPNAQLWLATVNLIYGKGLPAGSWAFSLAGFFLSAGFAVVKIATSKRKWSQYIPGGIAVGIGIYVLPAYTLPQSLGGLAHYTCKRCLRTGELPVITNAIMLVLGESLVNILLLVLRSAGI